MLSRIGPEHIFEDYDGDAALYVDGTIGLLGLVTVSLPQMP